jgi:hypothetical protein
MAGLERAAGGIDRAQRMMPAADQDLLGHHEAEISGILGRRADLAQQVGDHAVDAVVDGMKLLVIVLCQQQRPRLRRNVEVGRRQPLPCAGIGQVEMQPEQPVMGKRDRLVHGEGFRSAVRMDAKRPDQSRDGGRHERRAHRIAASDGIGN